MSSSHNPVYPGYFADPFVWKHKGFYYAVGTGPVASSNYSQGKDFAERGEERAFPLLFSANLRDWKFLGGALRAPDCLKGGDFWAPEVGFDGEFFYLYYSASAHELEHKLRVARSKDPEGPYEDVGLLMKDSGDCPFAIDPHPFCDDDGQWYLFYARDFLDTTGGFRAGTGLVMDRLLDMTRLAGEERVVLRARSNWQLFRANRLMYGRIWDWHTMEGPCVRKHEGRYYCIYSGGCYENETYGVDFGVAEHVFGPYSDSGNEKGPRFMKTVPGVVIGPGHQSIVLGPDDKTEYVAYHAWDNAMSARRFCLDPLIWTPEGPRCMPS